MFQNHLKKIFGQKNFVPYQMFLFLLKKESLLVSSGANGAGKTTSIKILMNFIKYCNGYVRFDSVLGSSSKEILSNIGYLPERPYFYPHLKGREFLSYMSYLNDLDRTIAKERIEKWTKRLKVDFALDRPVRSYSKGMLQRLGFASTLIHQPKLLVLDEPLSGLDPVGRKDFKDILVELNNDGVTIFFSSHIVSDVEEICEKVIVLEQGRLLYQGKIEELIQNHINMNYIFKTNKIDIHTDYISRKEVASGYHYEVHPDQKESFLKHLIAEKIELYGLENHKTSLEEVVYKVRT